MWKMISESVKGTSHAQSGLPCQDYCARTISGDIAIAACADGSGSAELSHIGSRTAVERFLDEVNGLDSTPTRERIEAWVDAARAGVLEEAERHGTPPRELACTFIAAMVGDGWAAFAQIGDGVIVFVGPQGYELVFWPDNGEYANTTRFLTEDDYRANLRIEIVERHLDEFALLTDGLQMLALDYRHANVHAPFFTPLFRTLRHGRDEEALQTSLRDFMDSKRVNDRTDDDKTLLLATRSPTDVHPFVPHPTA